MECTDDNLRWVTDDPTREPSRPHTYKQGRAGQRCEGQEQPWLQWPWVMEFRILWRKSRAKSGTATPDFRRADFVQEITMWYNSGHKRGKGGLVDFQGPPPSTSRLVHPDVQEAGQTWQDKTVPQQRLWSTELGHSQAAGPWWGALKSVEGVR